MPWNQQCSVRYRPLLVSSVTRMGKILLFGYFLLEQYLHFQLNKQLQNMVCCTYFNNQKELGVDVFDFQFEQGYLGYISIYLANFCSIFWSLCLYQAWARLDFCFFSSRSFEQSEIFNFSHYQWISYRSVKNTGYFKNEQYLYYKNVTVVIYDCK